MALLRYFFPKAPLTQEKSRAAKPVKPRWGEEPCVVTDSGGPPLPFAL